MQMPGFEAFLSFGLKLPLQLAAGRVNSVEPAAITAEIYDSAFDGGRRCHSHPREELPFLRSGLEIDGVKVAVRASEKSHLVRHRGRRDDLATSVEFPFDLAESGNSGRVVYAGMGQVPAEHGSILSESGQTKKERGEQTTASHFHPE